ncbi:UNVERIFIED_CONTAM: hypothetical protein HDU68_005510 [Siphonaria sp. JEL0065]|nr:hypothetical protein HDU68_005510 [Siphonaria sp. JEL0065]
MPSNHSSRQHQHSHAQTTNSNNSSNSRSQPRKQTKNNPTYNHSSIPKYVSERQRRQNSLFASLRRQKAAIKKEKKLERDLPATTAPLDLGRDTLRILMEESGMVSMACVTREDLLMQNEFDYESDTADEYHDQYANYTPYCHTGCGEQVQSTTTSSTTAATDLDDMDQDDLDFELDLEIANACCDLVIDPSAPIADETILPAGHQQIYYSPFSPFDFGSSPTYLFESPEIPQHTPKTVQA